MFTGKKTDDKYRRKIYETSCGLQFNFFETPLEGDGHLRSSDGQIKLYEYRLEPEREFRRPNGIGHLLFHFEGMVIGFSDRFDNTDRKDERQGDIGWGLDFYRFSHDGTREWLIGKIGLPIVREGANILYDSDEVRSPARARWITNFDRFNSLEQQNRCIRIFTEMMSHYHNPLDMYSGRESEKVGKVTFSPEANRQLDGGALVDE